MLLMARLAGSEYCCLCCCLVIHNSNQCFETFMLSLKFQPFSCNLFFLVEYSRLIKHNMCTNDDFEIIGIITYSPL